MHSNADTFQAEKKEETKRENKSPFLSSQNCDSGKQNSEDFFLPNSVQSERASATTTLRWERECVFLLSNKEMLQEESKRERKKKGNCPKKREREREKKFLHFSLTERNQNRACAHKKKTGCTKNAMPSSGKR